MKNRVGEILKGEEGMGTVEVILIILVKWSRETCCAYSAWSWKSRDLRTWYTPRSEKCVWRKEISYRVKDLSDVVRIIIRRRGIYNYQKGLINKINT